MPSRHKLLGIIAIIFISIDAEGASNSMFVEQREITTGAFNGFVTGMGKPQALANAKMLGAKFMKAIPCLAFKVTKNNVGELPSFEALEGIRLSTNSGYFKDIYFADARVTKVTESPGKEHFVVVPLGDQSANVRSEVLRLLDEKADITVAPILKYGGSGTVALSDMSSDPLTRLETHDCWSFEIQSVGPAGAAYELAFGAGGLQKVLYRRPRIRAE